MKVLCPRHFEKTPSCELYPNGWAHCFSCNANFKYADIPDAEVVEPEPEDLEASLAYIEALPLKAIRGLEFPADRKGYYLIWPDRSYYKLRFFEGTPKYIGAKGHERGLFMARWGLDAPLVLIEGEINALSVAKACPDLNVISPGSASDFSERRLKQGLRYIVNYSKILLVADRDGPGAEAVINGMSVLSNRVQGVKGHLMSPDANETLVSGGCEKLKEEIYRAMGLGVEACIS
jgi:hypothetical protein